MKALLRILRFAIPSLALLFVPFGLCQTAHTVTVGSNACNGGLSFVDANSGGCSNQSTVIAGDTINWVWGNNTMFHSTTSGTCVGAVCQTTPFWDSGEFVTGGGHTFSRVLNNPGVFPYFCTVHDSNMIGTVRVLPAPATFVLQPRIPVGTHPSAIVAADFNKDGKLDLAVANRDDNTVTILRGNGDGTFTPFGSPITGFNLPVSIAVADFNKDGNLDLAVANGGDNLGSASVTILLGKGDGTFTVKTPFPVGTYPQALIAADFDGDGNKDLAVAIAPLTMPLTANNVKVLLGNGDGTFGVPLTLSTNALTPDSLAVFDFNKDGKPDLAVVNSGGGTFGNRISIFLNTSTGPGTLSFGAATNYPAGPTPHGIAAGMFTNAQGNPTPGIAVPNAGSNTVGVFLADNVGNFTAISGSPFTVGNTSSPVPIAAAAADLNGDGYLDLAVVNNGGTNNNSESTVTTLMNDALGSFNSLITTASEMNSAPRDIAVGDFNGDGKPDLALANFSTNDISILLNGTSPFPPATVGPATHFGISVQSAGPPTPEGNPSTTAGVSFQITVTAYDAYQKIATGYRGTVQFDSSDGNAVLPGNYTFIGGDNGVHMFNVTLKTADPAPAFQTFIVRDTLAAAINGRSSDILVRPAATALFNVAVPSNATAGSPFNFTVVARDTFGNQTPAYSGTVQFSSSDTAGCVNLPGSSGLTNGVGTFTAKLITVGSQTLTATDSVSGSITGTSGPITVSAGNGTHLLIVPSASSTAVGQAISITVSVRDTCDAIQTGYTGTVHFDSTETTPPLADLPANYTFTVGGGGDNGSHTFTNGVTFHQAGTQTVIASDTFNQFFGTSSDINVTKGATAVSLSINPAPPAQILFRKTAVLSATINVTAPAAGSCMGTVTFFDGATQLGTGSVSGNQASFTTTPQLKIGKHSFTAIYNGDANFSASPQSPAVVQYRSPRPH